MGGTKEKRLRVSGSYPKNTSRSQLGFWMVLPVTFLFSSGFLSVKSNEWEGANYDLTDSVDGALPPNYLN